ncbi:MAG: hypothetical protein JWP48_3770 [Actinoallomurus sp.]|jgi:hypothetical protein|nr:hypothetical protein [Actinoallomurus sp.]
MTPREDLAAAQAALVAALVAGGPTPAGFDPIRVAAAARALMGKRAGEVARAWPSLAAVHGARWMAVFAEWARDRPARGARLDGWDFARAHRDSLPPAAALELLMWEAAWRQSGDGAPRRRHFSTSTAPGGVLVRMFGRSRLIPLRSRP